jgi:hypothetical protein
MTNLVPLYVDKNSGKIVASNNGGVGGGGLPTGDAFGYVHVQTASSNQWIVIHDKNTRAVIYQVYTDMLEHVYPDEVIINDENTITINFAYPMTGIAHLVLFKQ